MEMDPVTGIVKLKRRTPDEYSQHMMTVSVKQLAEIHALKAELRGLRKVVSRRSPKIPNLERQIVNLKKKNDRYVLMAKELKVNVSLHARYDVSKEINKILTRAGILKV